MKTSKSTRRALLGSFTSLLLCFAMLIGSTFAWFTDTASTSVNTIQAGKLDVQLLDESGNELTSALKFVKAAGADENEPFLWEPGCTFRTEGFKIKNNGDLDLKFKVAINGLDGDSKLLEVIEFKLVKSDGNNGFTPVTTNSDVGVLLAGDTYSDVLYLQGHMDENAGNTYQGMTLTGITVTVYATQAASEYDSFNNEYDKDADYSEGTNVSSVADMQTALANGATSFDFGGADIGGLNGNTALTAAMIPAGKTVTISNAVISARSYENAVDGTVIFENCTFDAGSYDDPNTEEDETSFSIHFGSGSGKIYFNNCTLKGWCSFASTIEYIELNDCTITGNGAHETLRFYQNAVLNNCVLDGTNASGNDNNDNKIEQQLDIIDTTHTKTVTLNNCTLIWVNCSAYFNDQFIYNNCVNATPVSNATDLATALPNGGTIVLTADIDANNSWTTASVSNKNLTLLGNGHTISKLNKPLINFYGGTCTINDLTVKDSAVAANGDDNTGNLGTGIILDHAQWANLYMTNCHVKNSSVNVGGTNSRAGALVGYWIGGGEIKNSSAVGCTVYGVESAGGIVGHRQGESSQGYEYTAKVTNCTASGNNVTSGNYVGAILGRLSTEAFEINGCTYTGNACGNIWDGGNGTLTIDGVTQ